MKCEIVATRHAGQPVSDAMRKIAESWERDSVQSFLNFRKYLRNLSLINGKFLSLQKLPP